MGVCHYSLFVLFLRTIISIDRNTNSRRYTECFLHDSKNPLRRRASYVLIEKAATPLFSLNYIRNVRMYATDCSICCFYHAFVISPFYVSLFGLSYRPRGIFHTDIHRVFRWILAEYRMNFRSRSVAASID